MVIENQIPKTETIYELKNEIPSFEEFMKTYERGINYDDLNSWDISEVRGYGPNPGNDGKGKKKSNSIEYNGQHLIHTLNNKVWSEGSRIQADGSLEKKSSGWQFGNLDNSLGASIGAGGAISDGESSASIFKYSDGLGDIRVGSGTIGYEVGGGSGGATIGYTARADVLDMRTNSGVQANIGLDGGSNFTAGPGGVEVKAAGFGVSVGKKMGFSTPIGGISVDTEEACVVQ